MLIFPTQLSLSFLPSMSILSSLKSKLKSLTNKLTNPELWFGMNAMMLRAIADIRIGVGYRAY
jgi:hypothetical protein